MATYDAEAIVDIGDWCATGSPDALARCAHELRTASEEVGFYQLIGHGVPDDEMAAILEQARRFHALPLETKLRIRMDRPEWPLGGVGYLPVGERILPRREVGNLNEAFLMKRDRGVGPDDNQWLAEHVLPGFREAVLRWAELVSDLALRLLPLYATALELEPGFFAPAFHEPFWRLRLSHYPPVPNEADARAHGIAPHVDTTFFTLLLQGSGGLNIYSHRRACWIAAPVVPGAFVVNSGELLRQWTNDRFLSTRHFADNPADGERYSVPFFFNATADYRMECLPTCHGPGNPVKYPPFSYLESQGVVQGE